MIRYNNEDKMFEGYNDGWSVLGGAQSTDKATYIAVEEIEDEDVIRFYTKFRQRMAVFNGTTNSWGIISNSNVPGDVYGMQGGVAIGFGFNKPESTLHVKGNMIVSSNVNIKGDYFKVYSSTTDNNSIILNSKNGGMTLNLNKDLIQTVTGNYTNTIGGNLIEIISGEKTLTVKNKTTEVYEKNRNITISGSLTETVTGDTTITYNQTRSLFVGSINTEIYSSDRTLTITGDYTKTITGVNKLLVNQNTTETLSLIHI